MPGKGRGTSLAAVALLAVPAWLSAAPPAITPEQAEWVKQLPPAQRELLRRALGDFADAAPSEPEAEPPEAPPEMERKRAEAPRAAGASTARLQAGDTVLIQFEPTAPTVGEDGAAPSATEPAPTAEELAAQRAQRLAEAKRRDAQLPKEPLFVLDAFGAVRLPHVGRITLAGLDEDEAAQRLAAEPAFRGLQVRVKRLPLEPELRRFGHDVFAGESRTFAPVTDIPVPADYVVGPGDTVVVQLLGKDNAQHRLTVTRDGTLLFPGIGPIGVAGMEFAALQRELRRRVERQMIGTQASVTLGRLRSIRVFVLGEVVRPGSYTVSSLSSLTNALLASGGVKPMGSLRDIQLKRAGTVVARLDLYDLLMRGDTRGDARLRPGDVIFVPPAGPIVGIGGRVRRPALYELKGEESVDALLAMAAGLTADADAQHARLERVEAGNGRTVFDLDLTGEAARHLRLRDGDVLRVYPMAEWRKRAVRLTGRVPHPGEHEWRPGMRLSDLLPSLQALAPDADPRYLLVARERPEDGRPELLGANLLAALAAPGGAGDVALMPRDEVRVFGVDDDRATLIEPLLERARRASSPERPWREVGIGGAVHHPGRYPWVPGMTIADLIDAGGGLTERAYTLEAELTRYVVDEGEGRRQMRERLRLDAADGDAGLRTAVRPHDRLVVRRVPRWDDSDGTIEVLGEVRFPGRYPIAPGERLSRVIERAGGLTPDAYPRAAVYLRESLRQREHDYLQQLIVQLERDLLLVKAQGPEIGVKKDAAVLEGEALLRQMRAARTTGRMVVNLRAVLDRDEDYDVTVQAGDRLIVPARPDEVTVIGEVYYPTSHVYVPERTMSEYVGMSGGITERGNRRAAYVVHADGSVSPPRGWLDGEVVLGPGDTIVVPVKVDRVTNLKLFTDISTILFQLSVTAAALNSIGVF